jgi:hypothetical protein
VWVVSILVGADVSSVSGSSTASSVSANSVPTSEEIGEGATPGVEGDFKLFAASEGGALREEPATDLVGEVVSWVQVDNPEVGHTS